MDTILLIGSAVLVCVIGVAAFMWADDHHVNPAWLFFAGNSLIFVLSVGWYFRSEWKRPGFVGFLCLWMVAHGLFAVIVTGWFPFIYWLPLFATELFFGYLVAKLLFGVTPPRVD